jgi:hypothetical protein
MTVLRSVNTQRRVSCLCALTYIPAAAAAQGRSDIPAAKNHVQNATVTAPTINLFGDIKLGRAHIRSRHANTISTHRRHQL